MPIYVLLAMSCVMSFAFAQTTDHPLELRIRTITPRDHLAREYNAKLRMRITYDGAGNLRLFSGNRAIFTSHTNEGSYIPFDCQLFKVASKNKEELVLTLLPEKSIPAERRVALGRIVVLEKSSCLLGDWGKEYFFAGIYSDQDDLRFSIYAIDDSAEKAKIYRLNDTLEVGKMRYVVKNILPADKEYPGWVELEEAPSKSEEKK